MASLHSPRRCGSGLDVYKLQPGRQRYLFSPFRKNPLPLTCHLTVMPKLLGDDIGETESSRETSPPSGAAFSWEKRGGGLGGAGLGCGVGKGEKSKRINSPGL